jgi:hypothetical protein
MGTPHERHVRRVAAVRGGIEVVTPTALEYLAAKSAGVRTPLTQCGVALTGYTQRVPGAGVLLCGLAGGLASEVRPGTVLIPALVRSPDGSLYRTDPMLHDALVAASRSMGFNPETGPMLTAEALITGSSRQAWADRGFVAADMEAALIAARSPRFATVRVVLDSAEHSISALWLTPAAALLDRRLWGEGLWLARVAPLYALRAARVARAALSLLDSGASRPGTSK